MGFRGDRRGQALQVGAVMLFAVLIVLLMTYQTTIVPNENRTAEFEHSLDVQEDMLNARNTVSESFQTGESTPTTIRLGTTYPRHTFGINPSPVSGSIRTAEGGPVSVNNGAGDTIDACPVTNTSKQLEYTPDYNYLEPNPTYTVENSVLYADYGDNEVIVSGQNLVAGDRVNLLQIQGEYSENGIAATDFDPRAGIVKTTVVEDPNFSVPTSLSEDQWQSLLESEVTDPENNVTVTNDRLQVELTGDYAVQCGGVGINEAPPGGERPSPSTTEINPATVGDVAWESADSQNIDGIDVTFNNTGDTPINLTAMRINFYFSPNKDIRTAEVWYDPDGTNRQLDGTFTIPGDQQDFQKVTFSPEEPQVLRFQFYDDQNKVHNSGSKDYFVVRLYFDNGESGLYFVSPA